MMLLAPRPHDLLWLNAPTALQGIEAEWVTQQWHTGLPVVVRRDLDADGRIPVGVRGMSREQRAAAWVTDASVIRVVTPESLIDDPHLQCSPFIQLQPLQAALRLKQQRWPWCWGITGSTAYALATGCSVLHAASDLDLLIRAPQPLPHAALRHWQSQVATLPCRADTQVETPCGAFALNEWLRDGQVLLKTPLGPRLTSFPWNRESQ